MALGDPYITVPDLKGITSIPVGNARLDAILEEMVQGAGDEVERFCNRQFNRADVATSRRYRPLTSTVVYTDDFWTTQDLVVALDDRGDRSYTTVLTPDEYELYPLDGVVDGQPGWPFYKIKLIGRWRFTLRAPSVRVTAKWGWEKVPDSVKNAALLLANETFALKGAPLGVAGTDQWGTIRVRENGMIAKKLKRFVRDPIQVGSGPRG